MICDLVSLPLYKDALSQARLLGSSTTSERRYQVTLGGNANADFMIPALQVVLASEGMDAEVRSAAYGNWISDSFTDSQSDAYVVWLSSLGMTRGFSERPEVDVDAITNAVSRIAARGTRVVVILPEPMPADDDPFSDFGTWRQQVIDRLTTSLRATPAIVLSADHLQRRLGIDSWFALRYWEQAKAPCHPDAASAVGFQVGHVLARSTRPTVKAVAVDLDDTMWGGLVGEVGPEGLHLDPDGKGRAFIEFQRFLVDLNDRGIAIGVVSKNEDAIAKRPFAERAEMVVPIDMFVSFDASWESKYVAIQRLATRLNIGVDSVCFIDDSAFEREEARGMLPGLIVPELPVAPDKRVEFLRRSQLFLAPIVTDEDRLRVSYFKREVAPDLAPQDLDAYLAGLEMHLEATRVTADNLDRVVALLHKTNQFNATMWRPSAAEVAAFVQNQDNYAYAYRLTDRLGDAGIISVLLASTDDASARIAAWVMSCRVFSRGVEWSIAQHLADWLAKQSIADVSVGYVETPRNSLVKGVLASLGANALGGPAGAAETIYRAAAIKIPSHHVTVSER